MNKVCKGYILIKEYPGSPRLGSFEKYTTGVYSKYPSFWKPIYLDDIEEPSLTEHIITIRKELGILCEKDIEIYDVWESTNGNVFIKVTEKYSLALGPKGQHEPFSGEVNVPYVKQYDEGRATKIGKIVFTNE